MIRQFSLDSDFFSIFYTLHKRQFLTAFYATNSKNNPALQVNLCQKLLFLHELTHNMTTHCSLNYKFNAWKFQAQTWGEHLVYRNCFWHSEQFLYTTCSPHVLQKEGHLTKIYLYSLPRNTQMNRQKWNSKRTCFTQTFMPMDNFVWIF